MFKVNRGYKELVERIDVERNFDNDNLPSGVISTAVNDDYIDDNKDLSGDTIGVIRGLSFKFLQRQ